MFITASRIHNGLEWLPAGYSLEINESGTITDVLAHLPGDMVTYDGILCPGFINVHCHTELSHMRGVVPEHTGLIAFLKQVSLHRNEWQEEQKKNARFDALRELEHNGIVAVGDIANTTDSLDIRAAGKLHFHTFVEALGFIEANASRSFGFARQTYEAFASQPAGNKILRQSITPHAPYSVSSALFRLIDQHGSNSTIAIHNQESEAESEFFRRKQGGVRDLLATLGIDDSPFVPTGLSSLQSYMQWLSHDRPFVFVHNTYTSAEDLEYVSERVKTAFWCLCPNANMYIENRLPDIPLLMKKGGKLCIGTDSLASNHQLSILSELVCINEKYPQVGWEALLQWGTFNGACALQMDNVIGSVERGKAPGILHIANLESNPAVTRLF